MIIPVEHQYKYPTLQEIEDALDLASLFLEATNRSLDIFSLEFLIVNTNEYFSEPFDCYKYEVQFNFDEEQKQFWTRAGEKYLRYPNAKYLKEIDYDRLYIKPQDEIYVDILRLAFNAGKDIKQKTNEALFTFFEHLEIT